VRGTAPAVAIQRASRAAHIPSDRLLRRWARATLGAGARVIETNTFGANAVRLRRIGFEGKVTEINRAAARLAKEVARNKEVYVAGSVGPLGISADEAAATNVDRGECFREQITALLDGGVDLLFFETFMDHEEMALALRAKNSVSGALAISSFACAPEGRISSGLPLVEAFDQMRELGAAIVDGLVRQARALLR